MKRSIPPAPRSRAQGRQRGAAAVEFALVLPILLAVAGGIIEFSYIYNLQISVTQAAREAARTMAIKNDVGLAKAAAIAGAPGLTAGNFGFAFSGACAKDLNATVTVTYKAGGMTGMFGDLYTLTGVGAMRCGG